MSITPSHHAFDRVAALFDQYRTHYGRPAAPVATRDWLRAQLAQQRLALAVAAHGEQFCGFITTTVQPAPLMLGITWLIRDLYVSAGHRRIGIARRLLEHALEGARADGALRVALQTETDNDPAVALYTAAGFRPITGLVLLNLTLAAQPQGPRQPS